MSPSSWGAPESITSIAREAGVGIRNDETGLAQIFGADDFSLLRFAEAALKLHKSSTGLS